MTDQPHTGVSTFDAAVVLKRLFATANILARAAAATETVCSSTAIDVQKQESNQAWYRGDRQHETDDDT